MTSLQVGTDRTVAIYSGIDGEHLSESYSLVVIGWQEKCCILLIVLAPPRRIPLGLQGHPVA
eukprot:14090366-Ditylum_brightwellii.AAC.1